MKELNSYWFIPFRYCTWNG